ncbi:MAG: hypothetical protein ACOYOU_00360 [Kiritimatiellia bacterium]
MGSTAGAAHPLPCRIAIAVNNVVMLVHGLRFVHAGNGNWVQFWLVDRRKKPDLPERINRFYLELMKAERHLQTRLFTETDKGAPLANFNNQRSLFDILRFSRN